jgi:hypothetical protein
MAEKPSLLEQVRRSLRLKHYSIRTERTHVDYIERFTLIHGKRYPRGTGADEIRRFLSPLATDMTVAATQNHGLCCRDCFSGYSPSASSPVTLR